MGKVNHYIKKDNSMFLGAEAVINVTDIYPWENSAEKQAIFTLTLF